MPATASPARLPDTISADLIVRRDVIEIDGRPYTVLKGRTTAKVRTLLVRGCRNGDTRTIRPRREARVTILRRYVPGETGILR